MSPKKSVHDGKRPAIEVDPCPEEDRERKRKFDIACTSTPYFCKKIVESVHTTKVTSVYSEADLEAHECGLQRVKKVVVTNQFVERQVIVHYNVPENESDNEDEQVDGIDEDRQALNEGEENADEDEDTDADIEVNEAEEEDSNEDCCCWNCEPESSYDYDS